MNLLPSCVTQQLSVNHEDSYSKYKKQSNMRLGDFWKESATGRATRNNLNFKASETTNLSPLGVSYNL